MKNKLPTEVSAYLSELGRKSAKARMKSLTKAQRREIAKNAAKARWAKAKEQKGGSK